MQYFLHLKGPDSFRGDRELLIPVDSPELNDDLISIINRETIMLGWNDIVANDYCEDEDCDCGIEANFLSVEIIKNIDIINIIREKNAKSEAEQKKNEEYQERQAYERLKKKFEGENENA